MSTTRKMIILFCAVVVLVGSLAGMQYFLGHHITKDPKQLFYGALEKNLSEKAVACAVSKTESGTSQRLAVQLDLASKTNARSVMTVSTNNSRVQTEEIVTKSGDYLRYTNATTTAQDASGKSPDFSRILNKWIKPDTNKSELFGLTALGGCTVPLAALSTRDAGVLATSIEQGRAFKADFAHTGTRTIDPAQPVREYSVEIQPGPYVTLMQAVGNAYGLHDLKTLNIKDYDTKSPRKAIFAVNTETGRLVQIRFTDESRVVDFSNFGKTPDIKAPDKTISNKQAGQLIGR